MSQNDGIRAYIKPATIDRYAKYAPVKMGQSVNDYLEMFIDCLENGEIAISIKAKESRRR